MRIKCTALLLHTLLQSAQEYMTKLQDDAFLNYKELQNDVTLTLRVYVQCCQRTSTSHPPILVRVLFLTGERRRGVPVDQRQKAPSGRQDGVLLSAKYCDSGRLLERARGIR